MQYILKTSKDELIWLDALLSLGEQYTGSLTQHPIESGGSITDHFIDAPESLTFTAVISNYDFLIGRGISTEEGVFVTSTKEVPPITVDQSTPSPFKSFVPEGFSNLIAPSIPKIIMGTGDVRVDEQFVKSFLKLLFKTREEVSLLGFEEGNNFILVEEFSGRIITSLSFDNTPSEDALIFSLVLEKPAFVSSLTAAVPLTASRGLEAQLKNKTGAGAGATTTVDSKTIVQDAGFFTNPENSVLKGTKDWLSNKLTSLSGR